MSCTKGYLDLHCDDRTTFQPQLSLDFFDPFSQGENLVIKARCMLSK